MGIQLRAKSVLKVKYESDLGIVSSQDRAKLLANLRCEELTEMDCGDFLLHIMNNEYFKHLDSFNLTKGGKFEIVQSTLVVFFNLFVSDSVYYTNVTTKNNKLVKVINKTGRDNLSSKRYEIELLFNVKLVRRK